MDYDVLEIFVIALGFAITYYLLSRINPDSYHVEPFMGMVSDGLFGGKTTLHKLPPAVPLLYLQQKRKGVDGEKYLNVLVPLPADSALAKRTVEWDDSSGEVKLKLLYEFGTNSNEPGTSEALFHETLIAVGSDVEHVEVRCTVAGGTSGGSGIGDDEADTEDPISGGSATPYMSSNVLGPCAMAYNGGDTAITATVETRNNGRSTTTLDRSDMQALVQPGGAVLSVSVGARRIANVVPLV